MSLFGWKSVHGDENVELEMVNIQFLLAGIVLINQFFFSFTVHKIAHNQRSGWKTKSEDHPVPTPKKIRTTTEISKRFVTLNKMHFETLQALSSIEANVSRIANSLKEISNSLKYFVNFTVKKVFILNFFAKFIWFMVYNIHIFFAQKFIIFFCLCLEVYLISSSTLL